jgi:UDP-glucose 4-epimerase
MKNILVTGAAGYIGSHLVYRLADAGYQIDALDIQKSINNIDKYVNKFIVQNITDITYRTFVKSYDAVVHLAGLVSVEQSCQIPARYAEINVAGTANLLDNVSTDHVIFASTSNAFNPVNPYAQTKLLAESIVRNQAENHSIFRFYNVAGSAGYSQIGAATHLIRVAAECATGKRPAMSIYGTDYDTSDGTCIRDYIHVSDIVTGIIKAVQQPLNNHFQCLGSGSGFSCREVIQTMKVVTQTDFVVTETHRRPGDAAITAIPAEYKSDYLHCEYTLADMCLSAYKSELNRI